MPFVHSSGGGCCRCHNQWGKYESVGFVVVGVHGVKTMTKTSKDEKTDLFVRYWFEFGQKSDDNDFSEWLFGKYLLKTRFVKVIRGFVYRITKRKLWIVGVRVPIQCAVIHVKSEGFCQNTTCNKEKKAISLSSSNGQVHFGGVGSPNMWQAYLSQFLSNMHQRSSRDYFAIIIRQMLPFLYWFERCRLAIIAAINGFSLLKTCRHFSLMIAARVQRRPFDHLFSPFEFISSAVNHLTENITYKIINE